MCVHGGDEKKIILTRGFRLVLNAQIHTQNSSSACFYDFTQLSKSASVCVMHRQLAS